MLEDVIKNAQELFGVMESKCNKFSEVQYVYYSICCENSKWVSRLAGINYMENYKFNIDWNQQKKKKYK